jgi:hypothetical protein
MAYLSSYWYLSFVNCYVPCFKLLKINYDVNPLYKLYINGKKNYGVLVRFHCLAIIAVNHRKQVLFCYQRWAR